MNSIFVTPGSVSSPAGSTFSTPGLFPDGTVALPGIAFGSAPSYGLSLSGTAIRLSIGGVRVIEVDAGTLFLLPNAAQILFGASSDLAITRDAADILASRRAANPQTYRIYNTYTDASNYERVSFSWVSNILSILTESAGTGVARSLRLRPSGATLYLGTNSTDRWFIDTSGHFMGNTDNATDIGAAGATRPRNIFVAGAVCNRVKAGTPADGDFTNPTDGMLVVDTTGVKIWVRVGGLWKGIVVA